MEKNELTIWNNPELYRSAALASDNLANSSLVPDIYRGKSANCLIAVDFASRTNISPITIMQNLYFVNGKTGWSSQMTAVLLQQGGRFSDLDFHMIGNPNDDTYGCYVTATRLSDNKLIEGVRVTIAMAKAEGWYGKTGSKWKTLPELMLRYRAQAFFVRLNDPSALMGLQTEDEIRDVTEIDINGNAIGSVSKGTIDPNALKVDFEDLKKPTSNKTKADNIENTKTKEKEVEIKAKIFVEPIKEKTTIKTTSEQKNIDDTLVFDLTDTGENEENSKDGTIDIKERVFDFGVLNDVSNSEEEKENNSDDEKESLLITPLDTLDGDANKLIVEQRGLDNINNQQVKEQPVVEPKTSINKPIAPNDDKHCVECGAELSNALISHYHDNPQKPKLCHECFIRIKEAKLKANSLGSK